MSFAVALLFKPFLVLLYLVPGALARGALSKWLPEGRLKRILLLPLERHKPRRRYQVGRR